MENQTTEGIPANSPIPPITEPEANKKSKSIRFAIAIFLIIFLLIGLLVSIYLFSLNEKKSNDEKYAQIVNNLKNQTTSSNATSPVNAISQITPSLSTPTVNFSNSLVDFSMEVIFRDKTGKLSLSIQLKNSKYQLSKLGHFTFLINNKEGYDGIVPVIDLGHDTFRLTGTVSTKYKPDMNETLYPPLPTDDLKQMTLNGTVNASNGQVALNITVGTIQYSFIEEVPTTNEAIQVAKKGIELTNQKDWKDLYPLFSSDIQKTTTLNGFITAMSTSNSSNPISNGTILSYNLISPATIKFTTGYYYFIQPFEFTEKMNDNTTKVYAENIILVYEKDAWKILSTDTPKLKK